MKQYKVMSGLSSRHMLTGFYASGCLIIAALIEFFPWQFLFHGITRVPALDITVVVFIALYMRKTPLLTLTAIGLLKDLYIGTPPGMHIAIYLTALGMGRFFNVAAPRANGLSRVSRGMIVTLLACFPEVIISGVIEGVFPPGHIMIWRTLLTALFFPVTYVIMAPVCRHPVTGASYGFGR